MKRAALIAIALAGGCLRDTQFHCTADTQCGAGGTCDPGLGYCTVPDSNCVMGRRYSEYSGPYTNRCVLPVVGDGGIDGPGCAPGFSALPGVPTHMYQLITTPADFTTQRQACAMKGGITYLTIPDDQNELQALVTLAAQPAVWVGIDDIIAEGNYMTVRGQPATFLPWAPGQPDNAPPAENCIAALSSAQLDDQKCTISQLAICECEP